MAEFVRQGAMGNYPKAKGGRDGFEWTHVILTKDEYNDMLNEIHYDRTELSRLSEKYNKETAKSVAKAEKAAEDEIFRVKQSYKMKYEGLEDELKAAKKDAEFQRNLNANLLRISRERANADRKISKKKTHSGYRVIKSEEVKVYYSRGRVKENTNLWRTIIQTPYKVDFNEEEARNLTKELFENSENSDLWLIQEIGIDGFNWNGYEDLVNNHEGWEDINYAVEKRLNANYREGYWEVIIIHTLPLEFITNRFRFN